MTGGEDPAFEDELGHEPAANAGAAPDALAAGPWYVRFAGRRSGPFDAERLRTLARRGALTRMHSLSADGTAWVAASTVRAVFNADGSVVAAGVRAMAVDLGEERSLGEADDGETLDLPRIASRRAAGSALVRPVVLTALALATVMVAMPTSRDDTGSLAWWWSEGALGIAVRGLCALAVIGGWSIAFLAPEPARAASVAAGAAGWSAVVRPAPAAATARAARHRGTRVVDESFIETRSPASARAWPTSAACDPHPREWGSNARCTGPCRRRCRC